MNRKTFITRLQRILPQNYVGLVFGFILFFYSLTPSLLPRPALMMGLIAGIGFALGYGIGVFLHFIWKWLRLPLLSQDITERLHKATFLLVIIGVPTFCIEATHWQNEIRTLVQEQALSGTDNITIISMTFVVGLLCILIGRFLGFLNRKTKQLLLKIPRLPRRLAAAASILVVLIATLYAIDGVLFRGFINTANRMFSGVDNRTDPGVTQPQLYEVSGSPSSYAAWESLGRQGRNFVSEVTSTESLESKLAQPVKQPIRVYAGIKSADDMQERANLVVRELERTGAFSREVLAVMTTTGSGWIEPQTAAALEYLHAGDTALATMQYSYLPSWISLLADQENATNSGKILFDTIHAAWQKLPENNRPKLVVYGLSLGSYGGQSAFSGASDMAARIDGGLFVGSPNFSEPWGTFVKDRQKGSPEIQPVYQDSSIIRFASNNSSIQEKSHNWQSGSRVLYVQHPSDPVVWWNPSLILHKPDWLKEPRGNDVSTRVRWIPFITFLQVTIDQLYGTTTPSGHGHNYAGSGIASWHAIVPNNSISNSERSELQSHILQTVQ